MQVGQIERRHYLGHSSIENLLRTVESSPENWAKGMELRSVRPLERAIYTDVEQARFAALEHPARRRTNLRRISDFLAGDSHTLSDGG